MKVQYPRIVPQVTLKNCFASTVCVVNVVVPYDFPSFERHHDV